VSHLRSGVFPLYSGFTEDAGRMMSASNRSATRSVITLNEPLACVRSKAIGAPVQEHAAGER
jgi:hypothetical protein